MKKLTTLLFASTLLAGFSSVAMGQSTDNETISANANVVQGMVVGDEKQDLEFNVIVVNTYKEIDAATGTADAKAATTNGVIAGRGDGITGGESRGYISIEIVEGTNVDLSMDPPDYLTNSNDTQLIIGFGLSLNEMRALLTTTKPTGTTTVSAIEGGATTDFTRGGTSWDLSDAFEMPAGDKVYLVLGGYVTATSDQEVGNYKGDFTLTATIAD